MAVFKVEKTKNYTVMSNYHLQDKRLSLKAKGLLSYMLSLPETWDYSLNGLCAICKEGKKAIRNILSELKEFGYLEVIQCREKNGYYKYEYIIREIPVDVEDANNNPGIQKGDTVEGDSENDTQKNKYVFQNERKIVKGVKANNTPFLNLEDLNPLTIELINRKYIDENDIQIYYYDKLFCELLNEGRSYKDLITMTHYITTSVVNKNFIDEEGNKIINKYGFFKGAINNCINKLESYELEFDKETGWFKDPEDDDFWLK